MAAPNFPTEEQILAEIQAAALRNQQGNQPRIKVGDQEFDPTNAQALQDAINNRFQQNQAEFERLQAEVRELNNSRVIKPELDNTPPAPIQQQQQIQRPQPPRQLSDEEWTAEFVKSPRRTLDETIGRMLGIEGLGSEALQRILTGISTELQASQLERKALLAKAQELDTKITQSEAERQAQAFIDKNKDYEINPDNQRVMEQYLKDYGLSATEKNLTLIYNQAKADGKIQVKQQEPQQNQQFTPQPGRQGVPRLGGQSQGHQDENYILEQANKLPLDEHFALIERLRNGSYQR